MSDGQEMEQALLPAREVALLFRRDLRTLFNWERAGLLIPLRIRKRRFYRRTDVEKMILGSNAIDRNSPNKSG
jgi:hypothetical protein